MVQSLHHGTLIAPWCNPRLGIIHWLFPPEVGRTDKMFPDHKHIDRANRWQKSVEAGRAQLDELGGGSYQIIAQIAQDIIAQIAQIAQDIIAQIAQDPVQSVQ